MNKKGRIIIPAVALSMMLGVGAQNIYAADDAQPTSLITKIAQKFNLSEDDLKTVFEEDRQERQKVMQARYEEMLATAVKNGEITEEQKQLIIAKNAEIKAAREAQMEEDKNLSDDERKAKMEEHREEMEKEREALEAWAKENGIEMKYLMMRGGHGPHGGPDGTPPQEKDTQEDNN